MNTSHALKSISINNSLKFKPKWVGLTSFRCSSNEPVVQPEFKERSLRQRRIERRKPKIESFAKNLFCGKVNTDIFAFPEILNKEELHNISQVIAPVENSLQEIVKKGSDNVTSRELFNVLKSVDVFGINVPIDHGGLALNVTETCKLKEVLWKDFSLGSKISHILGNGAQEIMQYGTDQQKQLYLPKICSGECTPVVCFAEPDHNGLSTLNMKANIHADKNVWILNGEKLVYNAMNDTDLNIVIALSPMITAAGDVADSVTIFLVDSNNTSGIERTRMSDNIYKLSCNNALIPKENILGNQDNSLEIVEKLMIYPRLSSGIACSALAKDLLSKLTMKIVNSKDSMLINEQRSKEIIGEITCSVYAMDSMIYLTAGLLDGYEEPDCAIETAILKVYSTEECLKALLSSMHIFGADQYVSSPDLINNIQSMVQYQLIGEGNDYLKLLIGMLGLQQAGVSSASMVKKIRNPFLNPGFILKRLISHRRQESGNPKLILQLSNYLHPSLLEAAEWLEHCILRLQYLAEMVLIRNGKETLLKQMEVNKLAIAAVEIYAMFASVSRASRSYCIGLQNANHEITMATSICRRGSRKVKYILSDLEAGPFYSNDSSHIKITDVVYKSSGNFVEHPLAINF